MIALILSITLSTYLVLCFKFFERFKIDTIQAIVFNYITCVITGVLFTQNIADVESIASSSWISFAIILGCSFFFIFNLMGFVAKNIGVTVTSVASKLSMVIPVSVAIILYKDPLTPIKIVSLILALIAVFLSSSKEKDTQHHLNVKGLVLAFIIFLGSGMNDTLVNYSSNHLMSSNSFEDFNISIFAFAALSGMVVFTFLLITGRSSFQPRAIVAGIVLGIPNYFSLLFLIKALNIQGWKSSAIFPINNIGIVVLSAVTSYFLFAEKFSKTNLAGLAIGIVAISLMLIGG